MQQDIFILMKKCLRVDDNVCRVKEEFDKYKARSTKELDDLRK